MENIQTDDKIVIRFSDITSFFKLNKWKILASGMLFSVVGAFYSLTLPVEYTSTAQILPELQAKSSLGGFRALADLAGINLDNVQVSEAIRPDLYPLVLESSPFLVDVSKFKIRASDGKGPETVSAFLSRRGQESPGLAGKLAGILSFSSTSNAQRSPVMTPPQLPKPVLVLTNKEEEMIKNIRSRISAVLDKKTGIIYVSVKMPDPYVAAWVADYSISYLTDYMLQYRSGKQTDQAAFLQEQQEKAKRRFEAADRALRSYRDRTRNPFMSIAASEESRLQSELNIAQGLYSELSRQTEQAQVKMREETPIIKILEPPQLPLIRSSPKRTQIVITFCFAGILAGVIWGFIRKGKNAVV